MAAPLRHRSRALCLALGAGGDFARQYIDGNRRNTWYSGADSGAYRFQRRRRARQDSVDPRRRGHRRIPGRATGEMGRARVIATASPAAHDRVKAAGADVVLDYSAPDLTEQVLEAAGGLVDRVIEVEFGANATLDTAVIAPNGTIVCYGSAKEMEPALPFYPLMFKAVTLELALVYILTPDQRARAIQKLTDALTQGALNCPVERVFPMSECAAAHDAVAGGNRKGAILLDVKA